MDFESGPEVYAICGNRKWKIKPNANTKTVTDAVMDAVEEYDIALEKAKKGKITERARLKIYDSSAQKILDATLEDFEYLKEAETPDVGPGLLGKLAGEVKDFTVAGGALGRQHARMQLDIMNGTLPDTSRD